jgi:GTP-binding protein
MAYEGMEGGVDVAPAEQVRAIEHELRKYDPGMLDKPRWLVLNKADLMFEDEAQARAQEIVAELGWTQPWFLVSAIGREGTWPIMLAAQSFFDGLRADAADAAHAAGVSASPATHGDAA